MSKKESRKQEREARRRSREIDAQLVRTSQKPVVILLAGSSGKHTFIKQMRIISGHEFTHEDLLEFRKIIYHNIIRGMQNLFTEKYKLGITLQNPANETHEMVLKDLDTYRNLEPHTFQDYLDAINSLWKDAGIQETYSKSECCEYIMSRISLKYFIDNIDRIGQLSYIPSAKDVLFARNLWCTRADHYIVFRNIFMSFDLRTTEAFRLQNFFRFHKEISIIFFVDSVNYDQVILDENSLVTSLRLFKMMINQKRNQNYPIIVFFNKTDLLAEKVQTADIREHFPEFTGDPHSLEDVQRFLVRCFSQVMENDSRPFIHRFITTVDTENVLTVFNSIEDIILQKNLKQVKFR